MCKSTAGEGKDSVSFTRWCVGMFCGSIFTLAYILAPPYVFSSILALALRYPDGNKAFLYAIPLIASILTPARGMPKVVGLLKPMLSYFKFECITENEENLEANLAKGKNYIFACQPHGVISFCGMCSSVHRDPKYRRIQTAVASSLLKFPILKNVMGIFSLTDASSSNLRKVLKRPGIEGSVVIYIGGMAELFKCCRTEERLFLSQRKGFIKLALREGVDIVPIYLFGNTSCLSVMKHGPLARMSRRLKLSFTLFWGKWFLPIPRDDNLLYVAGKAIEIPKIAEPSQEEIDIYHKKYVDEVVRIFNTYKSQAGKLYEEKSLFID